MPSASTRSCASRRRRSTLERVPMLRGRIVAANGIKAEDLKPGAGSRWVLQGDRGITYAAALPAGSRIVAGRMVGGRLFRRAAGLARKQGPRQTSISSSARPSPSTCSAATSPPASPICAPSSGKVSASISSLVFSPGIFAGAPHTDIATLTFADGGTAGGGNRADQSAGGRFSDRHRGARQGRARTRSTSSSATWCWRCAAQARSR